jgi:AmmeMemoRadiSam system protein B
MYPDDPAVLTEHVDRLVREARNRLEPDRRLQAIASPHGRFEHSGPIAGEAFACVQGRNFETVVLVGPDHYIGFEGIAVYPEGSFATPLGEVPIDAELAAFLIDESEGVTAAPEAHGKEHGLEMQLPFLQRTLPQAAIVPVLMGFRSRTNVEILATLLSRVLDRPEVLLVATTDLSHYHSREEAQRLDGRIRDLVQAFAPTILWEDLREGRVEACGGDALVAVMLGAGIAGAEASRILRYGDSGEASGNAAAVVGYLSAAFYRGGPARGVEFVAHEKQFAPVEETETAGAGGGGGAPGGGSKGKGGPWARRCGCGGCG